MKTSVDAVRDYLHAVERESSALPAERRQELLADLAEHIEVTRAERPGGEIGDILAALGDPRTIAATALAEAGSGPAGGLGGGTAGAPAWSDAGAAARSGKVHPLVPLLMLTLSLPFMMLFPGEPGPVFGVLFRIVGAVLLCTSVHWDARRKTTGVLLTAVVPTAVIVTWNLSGAPGGTQAFLANLVTSAVLICAAVWLWRVRRA
ncbi:hypothetical protein ACFYN0_17370 [Streptomyces sp. NPDC006704]|uniref:HAAS signaling domain-containing protein n=1 Tax=Streptomyces sp. NPDC006704 TaxID=3364760 RepID=UPI0036C6EAA3